MLHFIICILFILYASVRMRLPFVRQESTIYQHRGFHLTNNIVFGAIEIKKHQEALFENKIITIIDFS